MVSSQRGTVKAEVVACSRGLYDVTFVPHNAIPHFVNITFNDEIVPGKSKYLGKHNLFVPILNFNNLFIYYLKGAHTVVTSLI